MSGAIREIRRVYSSNHIILVVEKCAESLAEFCPYIDELIVGEFTIDGKLMQGVPYNESLSIVYSTHLEIAEQLLRRRIDIAFVTTKGNAPTTPLLAYMSGAKDLVSHSFGVWTPLLTVQATRISGTHTADIHLGYLEHLIRTRILNRRLEAWFSPLDVGNVQRLVGQAKKFYAIGLGGGIPMKHYPPERYAQLMNMLIGFDDEVHFVLVGGKDVSEEAKIIMSNVDSESVINLTGKISYRQTAAAVNLCDLYIGNDTGAMHLATATGKPILMVCGFPFELLRPGTVLHHWYPYQVPSVIVCPNRALPECAGSREYFGCRADKPHCITQITSQNLFGAFRLLLDQIAKGNNDCLLFNPDKGVVKWK